MRRMDRAPSPAATLAQVFDISGLRLGLQGQSQGRGDGREEPDSGARRREGPDTPTPGAPCFKALFK